MIRRLVLSLLLAADRRDRGQVAARHRAVPEDPRHVAGLVARYRIVPERSQVLIDARSSLHPIHTRTDGLEGFLDMEVLGGGRVNLAVADDRAKLSFARRAAVVGQPARGPRAAAPDRRPPVSRPSTASSTRMRDTGKDGRYLVRGDLTFRGVTQHLRGRDDRRRKSTIGTLQARRRVTPSTSATSAWNRRGS